MMFFGNSAPADTDHGPGMATLQWFDARGRSRSRSKRVGGGYRRYRAAALRMLRLRFSRPQPAFLTQNLHQPFGLISPSTKVQAFGSWKSEQLLHS